MQTNMLGLKLQIALAWPIEPIATVGVALLLAPFSCLFLPCAAVLATFVSAAVELGFADAEALWGLDVGALGTESADCLFPAATVDVDVLEARPTRSGMTIVLAGVAAWKCLAAGLIAKRDRVTARLSRRAVHRFQQRLATSTVGNDVGREWTMCCVLILRMAGLFASVKAAVEEPTTGVAAMERCLKPGIGLGFV